MKPTRILNLVYTLRNAIDFPLRKLFHWQRKGLAFKNEPKTDLYAHLPAGQQAEAERKAEALRDRYDLDYLYHHSPARVYRENLFYLELLERGFESAGLELPDPLRVVDIGPSHWFYVQALAAALKSWRTTSPRRLILTAFEADPYRVYANLYSRYDHALAHIGPLTEAHYIPAPFSPQTGTYDLALMLFPFVFLYNHLKWGLPRSDFKPLELLDDVLQSLKPGAPFVIVNQGENEHHAQRRMLRDAGIPIAAAFRHDSVLFRYRIPRFVLIGRRHD